ncbi:hypothetical protein PR048_008783 [Dryococelus australis]|uniref:Integrase catalytic domain-containing protein n=1 Tax=Dryococelus australis TaxID=614101 RepID=A0ABQ9HZ45_9NEOP|nr:hypothetical protein PR048_008783 [Dryococelus australis]
MHCRESCDIAEEELFVKAVIREFPFSDVGLQNIKEVQETDKEFQALMDCILQEFSSKHSQFWQFRGQLAYNRGFIVKGSCMFIPNYVQTYLESVWWPNYITEVKRLVKNCRQCLEQRTQRAEPLQQTTLPGRLWLLIGMDIFELTSMHYLVVQDYFSRFLEVMKLDRLSSEVVILRFTAEAFQQFTKEYGFTNVISSPKSPQSNGETESAVKIAKRILSKVTVPNLGLLAYRASPLGSDGSKRDYDARNGAYELDPLHQGAHVRITDLCRYGRVLQPANWFRLYMVATEARNVHRNRKQLVGVRETKADGRMRRPAQGKSMGMVLESHGMQQAVGTRAELYQLLRPVEEKKVSPKPGSEETAAQQSSPTPQRPQFPGSP